MVKALKIGIVADNYKVAAFEKALTDAGFIFENIGKLTKDSTAIRVKCDAGRVKEVKAICEKIQGDASRRN